MKVTYYKRNNGSEAAIAVTGKHESGDYLCKWFPVDDKTEPFRYHSYEFKKEFVKLTKKEIKALESIERHRCPRRVEGLFVGNDIENPDYWRVLPNGDKVCSYCGSLHRDSVLAIVKEHGIKAIEFSTKSYKWYIHRPNVKNASEGGIKYYRHHDTKEFIDALNDIVKAEKEKKAEEVSKETDKDENKVGI